MNPTLYEKRWIYGNPKSAKSDKSAIIRDSDDEENHAESYDEC